MNPINAIEVHNITKKFKVYFDKGQSLKEKILFQNRNRYEDRIVLEDISFNIKKGEVVGLIGENGCGKSTLLKMLTRIMYPETGSIEVDGRVSSLIELGAGFHPDMSGRENIYTNASIFGLSKQEIDRRLHKIIDFSELEEFIDNPLRTYSSGMYMRLAFAVAINVDADILLIDEILAVGDANFQSKCFNKLRELKASGITIAIVTHDSGTIERFCDRAIWINDGKICFDGASYEAVDHYLSYMNQKRIKSIQKEEMREQEREEQAEEENMRSIQDSVKSEPEQVEENTDLGGEIDYTSNRFGLKYIEITKAEIINEEGKATKILKNNENIEIYIYYKINKKLQSYVFGIGFYDLDGKILMGNNTQIDRMEFKDLPETGKIRCSVKNIPLLEGKYILNVAIVDDNGTPMDFYRNYCTFDVISDDKSVGFFSVERKWELCNE